MKIITITLNPAFDLHYGMKSLEIYKENYVDSILISAGGKGVNISRALLNNNIVNTSYIIIGKENGADFISMLKADHLNIEAFYCDGRIRENITIHTPNSPETRISLDNFKISKEILDEIYEKLKKATDHETILTFTGRIPKGLSKEAVIEFLVKLRCLGVYLAIDSNSFTYEDLIKIKPWLIKPNEQEIEGLLGHQIKTIKQAKEVAIEIYQQGIENVIISMGSDGAVAATSGFNGILEISKINPVSTIGAGDSLIAGFIGGYAQKLSILDCLKNAVSYGTAACLTEGTAPPRPEDIDLIKKKIFIRQE